jgi:hypothetical protein
MITAIAYQCPDCEEILYSRCPRDTHSCQCGGLTISDGLYNPTLYGEYADSPHLITDTIEVDATEEELYEDWNQGIGYYGRMYEVKEND